MFCTITPTRGDRPQLLEFCKHQLSRMSIKPDKSYFIDFKPQSDDYDLVTRVKHGISLALKDGFNEVYIIEDDDYYPADYFEKMQLGQFDFIGQNFTNYYNIRNKTHQRFDHKGRSSLFITGFRLSAMAAFNWPDKRERFLDIQLWKYAKKAKFVETGAVGIKHAIGKFAGRGHVMTMKNHDSDMQWLKQNVDSESYAFYRSL